MGAVFTASNPSLCRITLILNHPMLGVDKDSVAASRSLWAYVHLSVKARQ